MRGASRVRVVSIVDVVERYRQESTCCGGWVILKKCTAYFRLDVMGFFFFRSHFRVVLAVEVNLRPFFIKKRRALCVFSGNRKILKENRTKNYRYARTAGTGNWQAAGRLFTVYDLAQLQTKWLT